MIAVVKTLGVMAATIVALFATLRGLASGMIAQAVSEMHDMTIVC